MRITCDISNNISTKDDPSKYRMFEISAQFVVSRNKCLYFTAFSSISRKNMVFYYILVCLA